MNNKWTYWKYPIYLLIGVAAIVLALTVALQFIPKTKSSPDYSAYIKLETAQNKREQLATKLNFLYLDYEDAMYEYVQSSNPHAQAQFLEKGQALDKGLEKISAMLGLNVKREVALFQAWQYQTEQELIKSRQSIKIVTWHLQLEDYQKDITKQINSALKAFQQEIDDVKRYPYDRTTSQVSRSVQLNMDQLYEQAKPLIPNAVKALANRGQSVVICSGPSDTNSPSTVAQMVALLQYGSRFCPFLVTSKPEELCNELRSLPPINENRETMLALCNIADKRIQEEADRAQSQYGHLTYGEYYEQYVKPLVPNYEAKLNAQVKAGFGSTICDRNYIPVTGFRDPQTDAQIVAHQRVSSQLKECPSGRTA